MCFQKFNKKILTVSILSVISTIIYAEEVNNTSQEENSILPVIEVTANEKTAPPNVEQKTEKIIQQEMIRDQRDLVRYSPDVGISDSGRKQKGFAIRGVEGNRVGISIDGVPIPEFEENSLYARYGNFNNSRISLDPEFSRQIDIVKGSDSFNMGSGSLGGTVNYQTLNATDLVQDNHKWGGLYRTSYMGKNNEWVNTIGLAYLNSSVDALLMYSHRQGHELESAGGNIKPWAGYSDEFRKLNAIIGADRIYPDPEKHNNNSYLAKFNWNINPYHRVGLNLNLQDNDSDANELSYSLIYYWRENNDLQKLWNSSIFYEWKPEQHPIIHKSKWSLDYQKTKNQSITYQGNRYSEMLEPIDLLKDRRLNHELYRVVWGTEFLPMSFANTEHDIQLRIIGSQRKFDNLNIDTHYDTHRVEYYTLQHPIKSKQYSFLLQDKFLINDIFSGYTGLRYDDERIRPQDLKIKCGATGGFGLSCQNVDMRGHQFKNWSAQLGLNAQLNPTWQLGYQIGTGYRNPTASELYFTFESPFGNWFSNPQLKSEKSLNHNLFLQGQGQYGDLKLNLYNTRYKNFLFEEETLSFEPNPYYSAENPYAKEYFPIYAQRMENFDTAKLSGIEFSGVLDLNSFNNLYDGWKLSTSVGYSQGKLSGKHEVSLLSVQPLKAVLGLDYESPNGKWGVFYRMVYSAAKKAKDTKYVSAYTKCLEKKEDVWFGEYCVKETSETEVKTYKWLNNSATVFDFFGYYNINPNITLRAGIYNITNKKYLTWDAVRGISNNASNSGTTNSVGSHGQGLERFYAPGRNYAASIEFKF